MPHACARRICSANRQCRVAIGYMLRRPPAATTRCARVRVYGGARPPSYTSPAEIYVLARRAMSVHENTLAVVRSQRARRYRQKRIEARVRAECVTARRDGYRQKAHAVQSPTVMEGTVWRPARVAPRPVEPPEGARGGGGGKPPEGARAGGAGYRVGKQGW